MTQEEIVQLAESAGTETVKIWLAAMAKVATAAAA